MHEAVNVAVRQVSLGPPTMLSPKIAFHGMERADALRHIQSLVQRGEAVAGAGGKPPFGGNRPLYGLADAPEPNRSFTYSMMDRNGRATKHEPTFFENTWDSILSLAGKRRQRIHTEASATLELSATPQWSKVEIQFPRAETTQFIGVPSAPGQVHIVEVTVPVTIASKPQSLLFRAMAWFKESPSVTKAKEINTSLETLFKSSDAINVEEALIRYKTLMIDRYGASDVRIHLQREGSDIVVTDNGHEARSSRG